MWILSIQPKERGRRPSACQQDAWAEARERTAHTALLDLAPDAIFARDADRRITFWNRGAETTYGYSAQEALGVAPSHLLHSEYPMPLEKIERIVAETGGWDGKLIQHAKDGRRLTVESRWAAQYDERRVLIGVLEVNRDITDRLELEARAERERLQNQLHQARRLESLGELAGGIAHDFNNLLAVIINYTALIADKLEAASSTDGEGRWREAREDLAEVHLAAERAAQLIRQLLAFARREIVQPEVVDVNDVVREIEQMLHRTLGEHIELLKLATAELRPC